MKLLVSAFLSAVFALALTDTGAAAQARPENDPRFEKLVASLAPHE